MEEEKEEESIMQTVSLLANLPPTHCTLLNPASHVFSLSVFEVYVDSKSM